MKWFKAMSLALMRRFKRWERHLKLSKRQQFVLITLATTGGLLLTQLISGEYRYVFVAILGIMTYFLSAFALREDLRGVEWVTLLAPPTLFTMAVGLFYFLLPVRWLTRLPVVALYAIGMYALLLTENIYNVAVNRTIGLLRAAHSVGFLISLVTYFFLVQTLLAFRESVLINMLGVGLISVLLFLPNLWAMELTGRMSRGVGQLTGVLTIVMIELTWIFSFWPVATTLKALFFTSVFYSLSGLGQQYLVEKLYKRNIWELFSVVVVVFIVVMLTTHWRGTY